MRKYNSNFKTAFISEAGSELTNNDYFAYVELDGHACYVIADGITDLRDAESAKEAIHVIINEFQARPSISQGALKRYLRVANRELCRRKSYEKLKASITVVVTNYEKMRYAYAGNTRLRIYRDGKPFHATRDMSMSQDMVTREQLTPDALSLHEERNNLHTYLGMPHFVPFVSAKIKLQNTDIITLYTRGIWENIDEGELAEVFEEAGTEPQECCETIEGLLTSRGLERIENYTFAAIFVDKVFDDPGRRKRIKKIVIISVIAAAILLVVCIVLYIFHRVRERQKEEMNLSYENMLEYIQDDNFIRAEEECKASGELARKLYDKEKREQISDYLKLLEAVIGADDIYGEGRYLEAEEAYLNAKARSRYADNVALEYIDRQLDRINQYRDVYDNITLGDRLAELEEYELAEEKYLAAKKDAAFIYFETGKEQALDALAELYEKQSAAQEEESAAAADIAAAQVSAAELVRQGDETYSSGDYDGAMVFYLIALEKYTGLEDDAQITALNNKISTLNMKQEEVESRISEAKLFEEQGRLCMEEQQYDQAKEQYQYAKNIYLELEKSNQADEIQSKIDIVDTKIQQQEKELAEEEKEAEKAAGKSVSGNEG